MRLLITASTVEELQPLLQHFKATVLKEQQAFRIQTNNHLISVVITGVGTFSTTFILTKLLTATHYNMLINVGVCGSYEKSVTLTELVEITKDTFGDFGIDDNGKFHSAFSENLIDADKYPFVNGWLENKPKTEFLPVKGLTLQTVTGSDVKANELIKYYDAQVETMEASAVFYTALQLQQPFMVVRSVSNYVGNRNKDEWFLKEAIQALNYWLLNYLSE
jgi:futalosine hydrolase